MTVSLDTERGLAPRPLPPEDGLMTTSTVVTMVLILGFVWGGFSLALLTAVRKESTKIA